MASARRGKERGEAFAGRPLSFVVRWVESSGVVRSLLEDWVEEGPSAPTGSGLSG